MKGVRKFGGKAGSFKKKGQSAHSGKKFMRKRPVRRGQLISPFGVGSIMDFRNDEALMCAGLDAWFMAAPPQEWVMNEERLQRKLGCSHFIRPPEYSDDENGSHQKVPYVRFPLWHYCPRCFRMKKAVLFGPQPLCDHCKAGSYQRRMIPSRIVAVCELGAHRGLPLQNLGRLQVRGRPDGQALFQGRTEFGKPRWHVKSLPSATPFRGQYRPPRGVKNLGAWRSTNRMRMRRCCRAGGRA